MTDGLQQWRGEEAFKLNFASCIGLDSLIAM